jgi:hypothetical protein
MEKGLFFPSKNGDRKYKASDFTSYFSQLFSNGVFSNNSENLQVLASKTNGLSVIVQPGFGNINGYLYTLDQPKTILFDISDVAGTAKKAAVVLRLDLNEREISIHTKNTEELTRTKAIYELMLAKIHIPGNGAAITQNMIQDTRGNGNVCGYVSSLIDIDPTTLWQQFEADWERWLEGIKDLVDENQAAKLAIEIQSLKDKILDLDEKKFDKLGGELTGNLTISNPGGPTIIINSTDKELTTMHSYTNYVKNGVRKGWVGYGSRNNDDFSISNESGGNVQFLTTGKGKFLYNFQEIATVSDSGWHLLNSGAGDIHFRVLNGVCYLKGRRKLPNASTAKPALIWSLPAICNPKRHLFLGVAQDAGSRSMKIQINPNGQTFVIGGDFDVNALYSFDEVSWVI